MKCYIENCDGKMKGTSHIDKGDGTVSRTRTCLVCGEKMRTVEGSKKEYKMAMGFISQMREIINSIGSAK